MILAFERDSKLEQKDEFNSPSEYRKERMRLYDQTLEHSPDRSTQKQDNFKQTRFDHTVSFFLFYIRLGY